MNLKETILKGNFIAISKKRGVDKQKPQRILRFVSIYVLLIAFGYVFIYPLIYSVALSFMNYDDKLNPLVYLVPTQLSRENYTLVLSRVDYWGSLTQSILLSLACAVAQTISCGIVGYGFGKYQFPLKRLYLVFITIMFVVPTQITSIPTYLMFQQLNLINTPLGLIVPAIMGQGLRNTIFILIYYQVFSAIPPVIDEAAQVDGANAFKRFFVISAPLAKPAILLSFLFSFVWYWNETYLTTLYAGQKITTLPIQLRLFIASLNANIVKEGPLRMFDTIEMAAVILSIIPLLVIYMFLQRHFTESIDKTGITGE